MMLWSGGTVEQQDEAEIDSMCLRNRVPATQEKANTTPSDENEERIIKNNNMKLNRHACVDETSH